MGKKLDQLSGRKILEYDVISKLLPDKKKRVSMPVIANQKTVTVQSLLKEGENGGYFSGRPTIFMNQFECMMELVKLHLEQGDAVNLGGYLRIQPVLNGKIGATHELTRENSLAVRVTALSKLKLSLISFAWRRRGTRVKEL